VVVDRQLLPAAGDGRGEGPALGALGLVLAAGLTAGGEVARHLVVELVGVSADVEPPAVEPARVVTVIIRRAGLSRDALRAHQALIDELPGDAEFARSLAELYLRTDDPRATLAEIYAARVPVYALADLTVETRPGYSISETVARAADVLRTRPDVLLEVA